jgi:hypothetical protein
MLWAFVSGEENQLVCLETGSLITASRDGQAHLVGPGDSTFGDLTMRFDDLVQELKRRQVLVNQPARESPSVSGAETPAQ